MSNNAGKKARGSRGRGTSSGCGRGRGSYYSGTGAAVAKHKGLCAALTSHVFEYGQKGAADQMGTAWEKIVHHVGTIYGHNISNELQNKKTVVIPKPEHTQDVLDKHVERVTRHDNQQQRLADARQIQQTALEAVINAGDADAPMALAILDNQIEEAAY
jgi:hypothetical protein